MTISDELDIFKLIRLRDPREAPETSDQVLLLNRDGRTLIVSYRRKLTGNTGETVFYRVRFGTGPIGPARNVTLDGWKKLTAGGSVIHHAGVKAN